jgi:hypothetical protein
MRACGALGGEERVQRRRALMSALHHHHNHNHNHNHNHHAPHHRGSHSLETMCLLLALKLEHPRNVHLIRGNHEAADINALFGFRCVDGWGLEVGWHAAATLGRRTLLVCSHTSAPLASYAS